MVLGRMMRAAAIMRTISKTFGFARVPMGVPSTATRH